MSEFISNSIYTFYKDFKPRWDYFGGRSSKLLSYSTINSNNKVRFSKAQFEIHGEMREN